MEPDEDKPRNTCKLRPLAISDPRAAEEISSLMLEFSRRLEETVKLVHDTCSLDEWKEYKRVAGTIYLEIFVWILEPLYKKYPSLKPEDWD